MGGEILHVDSADVVVAGVISAARKGFLDAAAGSVDPGGTEDEGGPRSGGDALLCGDAGAGAVGLRIDRSGGVDVDRAAVDGGGGEINHSRRGCAEGFQEIGGAGGRDGMEDENAGVQMRGEIVEGDHVGAELGE